MTDDAHRLPSRTTPTWEVELLISGVAVFAMLQLPGWLDDRLLAMEPRIGPEWRMILILAYLYAKSAAVTLAVTFVLHLLLRALWIAMVGLHSVYPQGVRLDRLRMGPIQTEVERERQVAMAHVIERADNRASVVFAFGVLTALVFAGVFVLIPGLLLLATLAAALFGRRPSVEVLVYATGAVFILPTLLATLADRAFGARLRPGGLPYRLVHGVFVFVHRLSSGLGASQAMSLLASNDGQRRLMALLGTTMLAVCGGVGVGLWAARSPEQVGSYALFPQAPALNVDAGHYADQRDPLRDGALPYIQARVVRGPYVELVVPYDPRRAEPAMRACKAPVEEGDARARALLACLQVLHPVSLDGQPLEALEYELATDPKADIPALLAMIDVRALATGRHELRVARPPKAGSKPDPGEPDPGAYRIPFWR